MKAKKTLIYYGIFGSLLLSLGAAPASFAGNGNGSGVVVTPDNSNVVKTEPNHDAIRDLGLITGGVVTSGAGRYFEKARTLPVQLGKKAKTLFTLKTGSISRPSRWGVIGIGTVMTTLGLLDLTFNSPKFSLGQSSEILPSVIAVETLKKEATQGHMGVPVMPHEDLPDSILAINPPSPKTGAGLQ